jgi:hypothetical protein
MTSDNEALRKWGKLSIDNRNLLLANVFCSNCLTTTVVDYDIVSYKGGILIQGKCKQCGHDVARVVEESLFGQDSP